MAAFAIGAALLGSAAWHFGPITGWIVSAIGAALTLWCLWFFRDPDRACDAPPECVVASADGVVCAVDQAPPPPELALATPRAGWVRVCVFMNVFNVHVNRAPAAGVVRAKHYRPGKFLNASFDKASVDNERLSLALDLPDGRTAVVVQIAGLVARRIVCRVAPGATLARGERFGLIRFGSRVDVHLPGDSVPQVRVGDTTRAGETILAKLAPAAPVPPSPRPIPAMTEV